MDDKTYQERADEASFFRKSAQKKVDFWSGYSRGLKRIYYGEKFGTPEQEAIWLGFIDDFSGSKKARMIGYQSALNGHDIQEAMVIEATIRMKGEK